MTPRSKVIETSMRCFDYGIASLIPVIGVFLTPFALVNFQSALFEINDRWNPARFRLYLGAALAVVSLLAHAVIGVFIFLRFMRAAVDV